MRVGDAGGSVKPGGVAGVGLQHCFVENIERGSNPLSISLDGTLRGKSLIP